MPSPSRCPRQLLWRAILVFSSGQAVLLTALAFTESLPGLYIAAALFGLG